MKKILLILSGSLLLALGLVGILIPVLPTTPFVIVSAACFSMSSPKLHAWLYNSKLFGPYLRHYKEKTGISVRRKIWTLVFLYAMLTVSAVLVGNLYMTIFLAAVAAAVTVHIVLMRKKKIEVAVEPKTE